MSSIADMRTRPLNWQRVQASCGLGIAVFVVAHLLNTALLGLSFAAYDNVQAVARVVYQLWLVEAGLMLALLVHVVAAVVRWRQEPRRVLAPRQRVHRYAGIFLLLVIVGHIAAVRGPSWLLGVYPGASGLSFSVWYAPWVFYPYYFSLAMAGLLHTYLGVQVAVGRFGVQVPAQFRAARVIALVAVTGAVVFALALAGLGGALYAIPNPADNDFARLALDVLGETADE